MPATLELDSTHHLAKLSVTDPYTFENVRDALLEAVEGGKRTGVAGILVDRRYAAPATTEFVKMLLALLAQQEPRMAGMRIAIVAEHLSAFGMGRMLMSLAELHVPSVSIRVFHTYDAAELWLETGDV